MADAAGASATHSRVDRLAYILILLSVLAITSFGFFQAYIERSTRFVITSLITTVLAMLIIALIHRLRRVIDESFFIPLSLYVMFALMCFFTGSFLYFFSICLGICCMGALFFKHRTLRHYIIITNLVSIVLLIFKVPMIHYTERLPFPKLCSSGSLI